MTRGITCESLAALAKQYLVEFGNKLGGEDVLSEEDFVVTVGPRSEFDGQIGKSVEMYFPEGDFILSARLSGNEDSARNWAIQSTLMQFFVFGYKVQNVGAAITEKLRAPIGVAADSLEELSGRLTELHEKSGRLIERRSGAPAKGIS